MCSEEADSIRIASHLHLDHARLFECVPQHLYLHSVFQERFTIHKMFQET